MDSQAGIWTLGQSHQGAHIVKVFKPGTAYLLYVLFIL